MTSAGSTHAGMDVVFVGPTMPADDVRRMLPCQIRPPAAQGDVLRAVRHGASRIGLIDGYFEHEPAVWHKEILYALREGVEVLGAASMGALRAAELAPFGMVGVGWIFDQFAAGALIADDEVAVTHGPADSGFRAGSEALVNIRRTLAAALADGVLTSSEATMVLERAIELWFPDRSWGRVLAGVGPEEAARLRQWLPEGRVDQKRLDAEALLTAMGARGAVRPEPRWELEHTVWWDHLLRHTGEVHGESGTAGTLEDLLAEVRLRPGLFDRAFNASFTAILAQDEADRQGVGVTPLGRGTVLDLLGRPVAVDDPEISRLVDAEARVLILKSHFGPRVLAQIPDQLALAGLYGELADRAARKRRSRLDRQRHPWSTADEVDDGTLLAWAASLGLVPEGAHLSHAAQALGLPDAADARRCLLDEYHFVREHPEPERADDD